MPNIVLLLRKQLNTKWGSCLSSSQTRSYKAHGLLKSFSDNIREKANASLLPEDLCPTTENAGKIRGSLAVGYRISATQRSLNGVEFPLKPLECLLQHHPSP